MARFLPRPSEATRSKFLFITASVAELLGILTVEGEVPGSNPYNCWRFVPWHSPLTSFREIKLRLWWFGVDFQDIIVMYMLGILIKVYSATPVRVLALHCFVCGL